MPGYLKAGDVISGQRATCILTVYDNLKEVLSVADTFEVKNLRATCQINNIEVNTLNAPGTQHKSKGWTGSGTMTIYLSTSRWNEIMVNYIKTGIMRTFSIQVTNEDEASTIGRQTILLKDCRLNEVDLAAIDVDADFIDSSVNFTFDDADMLEQFKVPTYL